MTPITQFSGLNPKTILSGLYEWSQQWFINLFIAGPRAYQAVAYILNFRNNSFLTSIKILSKNWTYKLSIQLV